MDPRAQGNSSSSAQSWQGTATVARYILDIIAQLRNTPRATVGEQSRAGDLGDHYHLGKIEAFVRAGQPIELVLPAFPAKSSNPEKTLGILPDFGEVLALKRLNKLCAQIGAIHAPGARMIICSDGRVFSDLVAVNDGAVSEYGREIARIISAERLTHLSTYDLDDVFPGVTDFDQTRADLVADHGDSLELVRARIAGDEESRRLYNGIHRFLFEDLVVLHPELSRTKVRSLSADLAYRVIQRSNAWSNLVEKCFPAAVRLSIHPQPLTSRKIGVQLLPSSNQWRTPWHSVVIFDGRQYRLVRRQDAEAMGGVVARAGGRYPFYIVPAGRIEGGQDARTTLS